MDKDLVKLGFHFEKNKKGFLGFVFSNAGHIYSSIEVGESVTEFHFYRRTFLPSLIVVAYYSVSVMPFYHNQPVLGVLALILAHLKCTTDLADWGYEEGFEGSVTKADKSVYFGISDEQRQSVIRAIKEDVSRIGFLKRKGKSFFNRYFRNCVTSTALVAGAAGIDAGSGIMLTPKAMIERFSRYEGAEVVIGEPDLG